MLKVTDVVQVIQINVDKLPDLPPQKFEGYVWKTGENPNCRCVVIPPKSTYEPGDHVTVYDRYRFAIPVEGIVKMKSPPPTTTVSK